MGTRAPGAVRRPDDLAEFAYEDHPLPIAEGQTISQPYIVAVMAEAAEVGPDDRVLEVGAGSGYGAAVLSRMAADVWTIERHEAPGRGARGGARRPGLRQRPRRVGRRHARAIPEAAPFDAIVVTAGGPAVPEALLEQLADGGRLVIPVGPETRGQELVRVRRRGDEFDEEHLGAVRFVPLIGAQGLRGPSPGGAGRTAEPETIPGSPAGTGPHRGAPRQPMRRTGSAAWWRRWPSRSTRSPRPSVGPLLERIGDCPVVLLGEASHGTSEFYRMRAHITRELIRRKGFTVVAVEADWPDAARVDAWVRHRPPSPPGFTAFSRFPTWMWRNREVAAFVDWLRDHNAGVEDPSRPGRVLRPRPLLAVHVARRGAGLPGPGRPRRPRRWPGPGTRA